MVDMLHESNKYEVAAIRVCCIGGDACVAQHMVDLFEEGAEQRALQRVHLEDQLAKLEQIQSQVSEHTWLVLGVCMAKSCANNA